MKMQRTVDAGAHNDADQGAKQRQHVAVDDDERYARATARATARAPDKRRGARRRDERRDEEGESDESEAPADVEDDEDPERGLREELD